MRLALLLIALALPAAAQDCDRPPCPDGQVRNPATGQCEVVAS